MGNERDSAVLEAVRFVVVDEMMYEESWGGPMQRLAQRMSEKGVEYFWPGGSPQRRICMLVVDALCGNLRQHRLLRDEIVSAELRPIIAEVVRRIQPRIERERLETGGRGLRQEAPTRLVAWNICGGGAGRIARIGQALEVLAPSIVVLSEVKKNRLQEWEAALARNGFWPPEHAIESVTPADPYTVMVASTGISERQPWSLPAPFPNRAVRVRTAGLSVTGVHAPDSVDTGREFYRWFVDATAALLATDAILLGDFNADESGDRMLLNRDFRPLIESGWIHGTRRLYPSGDHSSWWGPVNAFALDHCLLSPSLAVRLGEARLLGTVGDEITAGRGLRIRDGALSDHRPLLVELNAASV